MNRRLAAFAVAVAAATAGVGAAGLGGGAHAGATQARPAVTVHCRFAFAVRWRTGGGPWAPLPPLARTAATTLEVAESQTVIAQ